MYHFIAPKEQPLEKKHWEQIAYIFAIKILKYINQVFVANKAEYASFY